MVEKLLRGFTDLANVAWQLFMVAALGSIFLGIPFRSPMTSETTAEAAFNAPAKYAEIRRAGAVTSFTARPMSDFVLQPKREGAGQGPSNGGGPRL